MKRCKMSKNLYMVTSLCFDIDIFSFSCNFGDKKVIFVIFFNI